MINKQYISHLSIEQIYDLKKDTLELIESLEEERELLRIMHNKDYDIMHEFGSRYSSQLNILELCKQAIENHEKYGSVDKNTIKKPSNINYIAEKMCMNKKYFTSPRIADIVAKKMSIKKKEKLIAYNCPFCKKFHVGHEKKI